MIVLSSSLVLAPTEPLGTPVIGWESVVAGGDITATSTESGRTAADLANPSTVLFWRAASATEVYVTFAVSSIEPVDYLAIAAHNFGSAQIPVSVHIITTGDVYTLISGPRIYTRDDPLIFRFPPTTVIGVRLRLEAGNAAPQAAVGYVGRLLVMPRGTSDAHVPINFGRTTRRLRQTSNNGHFLGEVLLSEGRQNAIAFKHLAQEWFRDTFVPFLDAATTRPFFFAWRPQAAPDDVGYVTLTNDPQPSIDFDTETIGLDLQMEGVAL